MTIVGLSKSAVLTQKIAISAAETFMLQYVMMIQNSGQKYIFVTNQVIQFSGVANNLLCLMQCWLNGVQIFEVFLAYNTIEINHAIQFIHPLDVVHLLINHYSYSKLSVILMCSPSIVKFENE